MSSTQEVLRRPWYRLLPWITAFAVAMGFLESAVVVYLRALYYPGGFTFPLVPMDTGIVLTELLREFATLVMLLAPGALIAKGRMERFAWFCWAFAVWDLFYYVFLKLLLGWPESIFTWDVLFLLPTVWVGPVLAPCMVSLGMLGLAAVILHGRDHRPDYAPARLQWTLLIGSGVIMLYTFMSDPVRYLRALGPVRGVESTGVSALAGYVPVTFQWPLFLFACAMASVAVFSMFRDTRRATAQRH